MINPKKNNAFTLLEITIVIIVIGILASIALPRFLKTMELSRATEALAQLSAIRRAMDRCYLLSNTTYNSCANFTDLDLENPNTVPNAHFTYGLGTPGATNFTITATRNSLDGGDTASTITITENGTKTGTGSFSNIK